MDASYEISADPPSQMVRISMRGFFAPEDVKAFSVRYRIELGKLKSPGHLTLVDITGMKIQSQDIVGAFSALMSMPDVRSRKLAFICGTSLARLQAGRLTDRESVAFFSNAQDAEIWLRS